MPSEVPDTTKDARVITMKALIIMHVLLIAFIVLVHLKLTHMKGS
ncbi:hypothetical protein [Gluconobacter morbifer]|uniref:Uncharacterized protein n=1 Tax=Gluconobacter morbifer G707 TaxID=1088869 RepID=G6XKA1_9PROT|nr:hypothetical protein [Gluconobacter morbifer]EHH67697.1 hypothetical protein GMO_19170 [Gluconobacter morbifer G707]